MFSPDFRYYRLDRNLVKINGDGGLTAAAPVPAVRVMHGDILKLAMKMFRNGPRKQSWMNAMIWSWYNWMPDYFFMAPASATHKYHPAWADRPDGLLLHCLAVCRVAASLTDIFDMPDDEYDALLFAAWHHDMFKYGDLGAYRDGDMTVHEHPILAGEFFLLPEVRKTMAGFGISGEECDAIADMISKHAGPYRSSRFSDYKLPACDTRNAKLLYKADYIASRKEDGWVSDALAEIPMPGQ